MNLIDLATNHNLLCAVQSSLVHSLSVSPSECLSDRIHNDNLIGHYNYRTGPSLEPLFYCNYLQVPRVTELNGSQMAKFRMRERDWVMFDRRRRWLIVIMVSFGSNGWRINECNHFQDIQ